MKLSGLSGTASVIYFGLLFMTKKEYTEGFSFGQNVVFTL